MDITVADFLLEGGRVRFSGELPELDQVEINLFAKKFIHTFDALVLEGSSERVVSTIRDASVFMGCKNGPNYFLLFGEPARELDMPVVLYRELESEAVLLEVVLAEFRSRSIDVFWAFSMPTESELASSNYRVNQLAISYVTYLSSLGEKPTVKDLDQAACLIDGGVQVSSDDVSGAELYPEFDNKSEEQLILAKRGAEGDYWVNAFSKAGPEGLSNSHYEFYYTTQFGLEKSHYDGKKVLDIGCGPRGSLEWADNAEFSIGLDPLVPLYEKLGTDKHRMKYVSARSEEMPFEDGVFDVVASVNSLDHVDDLDLTIAEIKRVTATDGLFLLLTDVNHEPTPTEPIFFSWDIAEKFQPEFKLISTRRYEKLEGGLSETLNAPGNVFDDSNFDFRPGTLSAMFKRL